ncbi:MAG: methionyl-tRNA formyltransferase [Bacillales bacterium]|nr:methionyl-tRNA formyltransferase [Bacillales bacterium]
MNKKIKICFMGTPEFGANVLKKLIENYTVVLVVTQPDKKGKRGSELLFSPVKELALSYDLPIFQPEDIRNDFNMMKEYDFDFLVTAAYGQFIPLDVLHLAHFLTLNVHGSLLPKYRGGAPIQRAIEAGDKYLGVTIMRTILKMDAGVMFKQSKILLEDDDTFATMIEKLSKKGAEDLLEVIDKFYSGEEIEGIHQNVDEISFAYNIKKEECLLDFNSDALTLHNKIRAFNPNPLTFFNYKSESYKVYKSEVIENDDLVSPGTIIDNNKKLVIKCMKNALSIKEIQSPGKKAMDISSFLNGKRDLFKIGEIIR